MISRTVRAIGIRSARFATWDHSRFTGLQLSEVEEHIQENKEWGVGPDPASQINKFVVTLPKSTIKSKDISEYIDVRGGMYAWSPPAYRTLSSLLTFPLSMAYGLSKIFPAEHKVESLNILVVGARSESSLPMVWWREMLCASNSAVTHNIRMVGPGLQQNKSVFGSAKASVTLKDDQSDAQKKTINMVNNYTTTADKRLHNDFCAMHDHPDHMKLLRWADVFVLFNPGYGNDTLKDLWAPTMHLLLQTRKPVLCTAYGQHDLRRDLQALDRISAEGDDQELGEPLEFIFHGEENPYKSFKCTIDPTEKGDSGIVTTNHSIYAFQAK